MDNQIEKGMRLLNLFSIVLLCSGGIALLLKLLAHSKGDDQGFIMTLVGTLGLLIHHPLSLLIQKTEESAKSLDHKNSANQSNGAT